MDAANRHPALSVQSVVLDVVPCQKNGNSQVNVASLRLVFDPDCFHIDELADTVPAKFPSLSGVFNSADRNSGVRLHDRVNEDRTGFDSFCETHGVLRRSCPDAGSETKV